MPQDGPLRVLIAGGGVAALETALTLHELADGRTERTLLADTDDFVYRAQSVGAPFGLGDARHVPLRTVARHTGATFVHGRVGSVDAAERRVVLDDGTEQSYDALLVALGATPVPTYPGATTWRDDDPTAITGLVRDVEEGYSQSIAFVIPPGPTWPLPAYELAIMLARTARGMSAGPAMHLVTPEDAPLAAFGTVASDAVAGELREAGVQVHAGAYAEVDHGHRATVRLRPSDELLEVDRVVALPRLEGREVPGLPADEHGFLVVDEHCAVRGLDRIWAAGDGIAFPIKQGGLAAEQADAASSSIAALAGADVTPEPFRPVLRGVLLTGAKSRYLQYDAGGGAGEGETGTGALWWPPGKVAGRRLAPYLARMAGGIGMPERLAGEPPAGTPVETPVERPAG
jgi:sulfide:quinone oxidoreductase